MLTSNWDFSHVEKNFAVYYRLCFGVVITMRTHLKNTRPVSYGIGSKPLIWFNEENLISEYLKK